MIYFDHVKNYDLKVDLSMHTRNDTLFIKNLMIDTLSIRIKQNIVRSIPIIGFIAKI